MLFSSGQNIEAPSYISPVLVKDTPERSPFWLPCASWRESKFGTMTGLEYRGHIISLVTSRLLATEIKSWSCLLRTQSHLAFAILLIIVNLKRVTQQARRAPIEMQAALLRFHEPRHSRQSPCCIGQASAAPHASCMYCACAYALLSGQSAHVSDSLAAEPQEAWTPERTPVLRHSCMLPGRVTGIWRALPGVPKHGGTVRR